MIKKIRRVKVRPLEKNVFKILDNARTAYELALKDGLHIKWLKPALNKQKSTQGYYLVGLGFMSPEDLFISFLYLIFTLHHKLTLYFAYFLCN